MGRFRFDGVLAGGDVSTDASVMPTRPIHASDSQAHQPSSNANHGPRWRRVDKKERRITPTSEKPNQRRESNGIASGHVTSKLVRKRRRDGCWWKAHAILVFEGVDGRAWGAALPRLRARCGIGSYAGSARPGDVSARDPMILIGRRVRVRCYMCVFW